jgi:hypothetical protein
MVQTMAMGKFVYFKLIDLNNKLKMKSAKKTGPKYSAKTCQGVKSSNKSCPWFG